MTIDTNSLSYAERLLAARRHEPTPWLVWHSAEGERIELSGRVFDNWVAKSANLLGEVFDITQGSLVVIDLPSHWKSLVLAVAALHHGASVLPSDHPRAGEAQLWITNDPASQSVPASAEVLAVDLAALALSFNGDLGPAEDYNASVRSFADGFLPQPVAGSVPALLTADGATEYSKLFGAQAQPLGTILIPAGLGLQQLLPFAIAQWGVGDALVLLGPGVEPTERLLSGERVTSHFPQD